MHLAEILHPPVIGLIDEGCPRLLLESVQEVVPNQQLQGLCAVVLCVGAGAVVPVGCSLGADVVEVLGLRGVGGGVGLETRTAVAAHRYPTGEFPGPIRVPGWSPGVLLDPIPCACDGLGWDTRIGYWDGRPLLSRTFLPLDLLLVGAHSVLYHRDRCGSSLLLAPPEGPEVGVTKDDVPDRSPTPPPVRTSRRGSTISTKVLGNLVNGVPVGDHIEDLVDEGHTIWVNMVVVVGIVESVGGLTRANDLTLLGFPHPPPTGPLCGLRPLELR